MLRGRHRGLPVAIDRAVMLPVEFRDDDDGPNLDTDDEETAHPTQENGIATGELHTEKNTRFQDPSPHRGVSFRSVSVGSRVPYRRRPTFATDDGAAGGELEVHEERPIEDV